MFLASSVVACELKCMNKPRTLPWLKCGTEIQALFHYLSVMLASSSCSFTSISFPTNWYMFWPERNSANANKNQ